MNDDEVTGEVPPLAAEDLNVPAGQDIDPDNPLAGTVLHMAEGVLVLNGQQHGLDKVLLAVKVRGQNAALIVAMEPLEAGAFAKGMVETASEVSRGRQRAAAVLGKVPSIINPGVVQPKIRRGGRS